MKLILKVLDNKYILVRLLVERYEIDLGMFDKKEADALLEEMKISFVAFREEIKKLK